MIKLTNVHGLIQVDDKLKNYSQMARKNMQLNDSGNFHYFLKAHNNSSATIIIENDGKSKSFKLESKFRSVNISNAKSRIWGKTKTTIGKIWAAMGGSTGDYENGNTAVGVRG
ncbi:MAG: hypothetical protein HQ541_12265 [Mariniphaga sp.]|nr:hypothetical protein [Mariniphaga sp.]